MSPTTITTTFSTTTETTSCAAAADGSSNSGTTSSTNNPRVHKVTSSSSSSSSSSSEQDVSISCTNKSIRNCNNTISNTKNNHNYIVNKEAASMNQPSATPSSSYHYMYKKDDEVKAKAALAAADDDDDDGDEGNSSMCYCSSPSSMMDSSSEDDEGEETTTTAATTTTTPTRGKSYSYSRCCSNTDEYYSNGSSNNSSSSSEDESQGGSGSTTTTTYGKRSNTNNHVQNFNNNNNNNTRNWVGSNTIMVPSPKTSNATTTVPSSSSSSSSATILHLGSDTMAVIVSFLEPPETLRILTAPLCKRWRQSYTAHQDLWMTLCCTDPFAAKLRSPSSSVVLSSLSSTNGATSSASSGYYSNEYQQRDRYGDTNTTKISHHSGCSPDTHQYGQEDNDDFDDDDSDDDDDSFCSLNGVLDRKLPPAVRTESSINVGTSSDTCDDVVDADLINDQVLGEYRLLYTSFVRCLNYLKRIEDDARSGRPPSVMGMGSTSDNSNSHGRLPTFGVTQGLQQFLAARKNRTTLNDGPGVNNGVRSPDMPAHPIGVLAGGNVATSIGKAGASSKLQSSSSSSVPPTEVKYGNSMITARLLGPTATGVPSHLNLPTNCAMYSIVNWMVAYPNVEGIQRMCICTLPALLEDEQQRLTAQRVGLNEVVLGAMLRFPDSVKLHTAAFHSMVLLARPLGGREGMLFDNTMAETTRSLELTPSIVAISSSRNIMTHRNGITNLPRTTTNGQRCDTSNVVESKKTGTLNGICILIDSMDRFESNEKLQAAACWAMVNLALVPSQKTLLLSLGGIQAATNAMTRHPKCFDVQFRALFALINLVVPSKRPVLLDATATGGTTGRTEKDVLDEWASHIARLVVLAMENFCSSETILNRACLVLHNLSQSADYVAALIWTPHTYQMLEWCMTNHSTDPVLRKSASSTLNRMQTYLSQHPAEQRRFLQTLQGEQQQQQQQQRTATTG